MNQGRRNLLDSGLERLNWKNNDAYNGCDTRYFSTRHFGTACSTKSPGDFDKVDPITLS